ncbi:MAG TPA: DUF4476 domain-containing protein [Sphingobacteriaceae bacterium]|nr:DUF4476 domain-containing protein [Sphingobacteriaceae bacterium]
MKIFLLLILGSFLTLSSVAQNTSKVTIIFKGINKTTNNYQVLLDETSYYSNTNTRNVPNYRIVLNNVNTGSHTLKIYRLKNNNPVYNSKSQNTFVYSKNFEVRSGYDMNITVLTTGQVQFSEQIGNVNDVPSTVKSQMTDSEYNRLMVTIRDKWSQSLKGEAIRDAFINTNNYFSTLQIRKLLMLITSESDRLDLVKLSYRGVTDPVNFTQLADVFISTENKTEFNNYVRLNGGQIENTAKTQITEYEFNRLTQSIRDKWSQSLKSEAIRDAFNNTNNYFSTSQIRQLLGLVTSESNKLDLVKLSYRGVTDPNNFTQLANVFNSSANRAEFNNYVRTNSGQIIENTAKTQMTDYDFNRLTQSVRDKWSQSLKGEAVRDAVINTNNYFSSAQLRQLLTFITSESDRLELAKLSFRSVTDSNNFIQLADLFTSASHRTEFNTFVNTQMGGVSGNTVVRTPMANSEFSLLVLSVRSNLLQILKVSAEREVFNNPNNYFTTAQVRQLISLINSEPNRLELAKLSYRTVTDRNNFMQLNDLFTTQSSRDALANYIKTYREQ